MIRFMDFLWRAPESLAQERESGMGLNRAKDHTPADVAQPFRVKAY